MIDENHQYELKWVLVRVRFSTGFTIKRVWIFSISLFSLLSTHQTISIDRVVESSVWHERKNRSVVLVNSNWTRDSLHYFNVSNSELDSGNSRSYCRSQWLMIRSQSKASKYSTRNSTKLKKLTELIELEIKASIILRWLLRSSRRSLKSSNQRRHIVMRSQHSREV